MVAQPKSHKYYALHNNGKREHNEMVLSGISESKRKKFNHNMRFMLIEKTCEKNGSEDITNIISLDLLQDCYLITKGRQIYDYTGIVSPLIHLDGKIYTFSEYCEMYKK